MYRLGKYDRDDKMFDLVSAKYPILLVMSRFGIALGFGDKKIGEVCRENGVDTDTFLAVVNTLLDKDHTIDYSAGISIGSLVDYLHNSHDYFLDFRLPAIREKLASVLGGESNELNKAILNYFDEYVSEVRKHMSYEESTLFPYVRQLLQGGDGKGYTIDAFSKQHGSVEARLTEFKNIMIKYYPAQSTNEINGVLFDIFSCEKDLASHNDVEDRLLVPAIAILERKNRAAR